MENGEFMSKLLFVQSHFSKFLAADGKAASRSHQLEVDLRQECFSRIPETRELKEFWKETVRASCHIVTLFDAASDDNGEEQNKELASASNHLRRLPVILLEDILDALATTAAYKFWKDILPSDVLFGEVMWNAEKRPCWLPLLKVANKFLRRLQADDQSAAASDVLLLLSGIYPLSEKFVTRQWGSHNADNLTILDSEVDFEEQKVDLTKKSEGADYNYYEMFWKLQHDFRNANRGVAVPDFLRRLETVLRSFQSHATTSASAEPQLQPFLTQSRLLPSQLTDSNLRSVVLTQFWIVAHHLMSLQIPYLRAQLETHMKTAESLLPPDHLKFLQTSAVFNSSEPQWRKWKQNRFQPDPEAMQSVPEFSGRKRKRLPCTEEAIPIDDSLDLQIISLRMRQSAPNLKDHLEDYVDALDPDAGIEAEYHPKNNAVFAWRALRLLSTDQLEHFERIRPEGDFEGMVRHIYKTQHGVEIPGDGPPPADNEDEDEVAPAVEEEEAPIVEESETVKEAEEKENAEMEDDEAISLEVDVEMKDAEMPVDEKEDNSEKEDSPNGTTVDTLKTEKEESQTEKGKDAKTFKSSEKRNERHHDSRPEDSFRGGHNRPRHDSRSRWNGRGSDDRNRDDRGRGDDRGRTDDRHRDDRHHRGGLRRGGGDRRR